MKPKYYIIDKGISRWKIDNKLENFLSHKADKSELWKKMYVLFYNIFDNKYYKKGLKLAEEEIKRQRPNIKTLYPLSDKFLKRDMIYSLHRFGASFNDYFIYRFYDLNFRGREKFNTLKLQYGFCSIENSKDIREICEDKIHTYNKFKKYYKRKVFAIKQSSDLKLLPDFLNQFNKVIIKPLRGHSGQGIKIIKTVECDNKLLSKYIETGGMILEEVIVQDERMAYLNKDSINTIRIGSFNRNNEIFIYGAAVRIGRKGSVVDNAGAGGIFALLDAKRGFVIKPAVDTNSNVYITHPDNNIPIPGFQVPQWDEAIQMIKEMALELPEGKLLSWDIALSSKGWSLIEINDIGDPHLLQSVNIEGNKETILKFLEK